MRIRGSIKDISTAFLRMCSCHTQKVIQASEHSLCGCHINRRRPTRLDAGVNALALIDKSLTLTCDLCFATIAQPRVVQHSIASLLRCCTTFSLRRVTGSSEEGHNLTARWFEATSVSRFPGETGRLRARRQTFSTQRRTDAVSR